MSRVRRLLSRMSGVLSSVSTDRSERAATDCTATDCTATERVDVEIDRTRSEVDLLVDEGMTSRSYLYHLVEAADGPVRQQRLVEESRLPESTVSRLLSEFESEGHLVRHRIGRENVVCLPGRDPVEFDPGTPATSTNDPRR
ncbi:helix-turn-helix transcriptional regulator, partial [Halobium palmae]